METHTSHTVDCRKALCVSNSSSFCHHRCKPDLERLWFSKRNQECRIQYHAFCECWIESYEVCSPTRAGSHCMEL